VRATWMKPRILLALTGCCVALMAALPAGAETKVEGYYSAEITGQKDDGKWRVGPPGANGIPSHYADLKFWAWPTDKIEAFVKIRAEANRDDDRSAAIDYYAPPWFDGEGHLKFRDKNYEAYLFYRESRFYINNEPLLRLVDDNKLKNDDWGPKAQGVRFDFWDTQLGIRNMSGTFIISDNGGTFSSTRTRQLPNGTTVIESQDFPNGDDNKIFRLGHKAWDGRIVSGVMYLRKDWTDTSQENWRELLPLMHNDVFSFDVSFSPRNLVTTGLRLGPIDLEQSRWTTEMAWSQRPYDETVFGASDYHAMALALEERDIHIGDFTLHSWYNNFGENFRDYMSYRFDEAGEYNRIQKHAELIWLVPLKAVTTKAIYDTQHKIVADEPGGGLRPSTEWYGELYMEFINGFNSRLAYRNWHGYDASLEVNDFISYPDWFWEVSVQNFLAKIRLQARLHDVGTFRQVTVYGFDMSVNLTERLKGYLRALNVNEETEARHTLFAELKYDIGWGANFYFSYGDAGQSDNLVYTDWFVNEGSNANLSDRIRLRVEAWF